jgi:hypothetical protein
LTIGPSLEGDHTISHGKESIVATSPNILAGVELRATLPDDNASGLYLLTTETLHTKAFRVTIATVSA